jgi:hypothetical protein
VLGEVSGWSWDRMGAMIACPSCAFEAADDFGAKPAFAETEQIITTLRPEGSS